MGFEPMRFWNDFTDRRFRPLSHPLKNYKFSIKKIVKKWKPFTKVKTLSWSTKRKLDRNKNQQTCGQKINIVSLSGWVRSGA